MGYLPVGWFLFLVCFVRTSQQNHKKGECKVQCVTEQKKICSEAVFLDVNYDPTDYPYPYDEILPRTLLNSNVMVECHGDSVGFQISWTIKGEDILKKWVKKFFIEFEKNSKGIVGGKPSEEVCIDISKLSPNNISLDQNIAFQYFFHGTDFLVKPDVITSIYISSDTEYYSETLYERIPVLSGGISGCPPDSEGTTAQPEVVYTTSQILTGVGLLITLIVLIIIVMAIIRRQRSNQKDDTDERRNLLILLNPAIRDTALKEHVTQIATRLSQKANQLVHFNIANMTEISKRSLLEWLTEHVKSANVIILFSVPDATQRDLDFDQYNGAFSSIFKRLVEEDTRENKILVVRTKSMDEHRSCPFIKSGLYNVEEVSGEDNDWLKILRKCLKGEVVEERFKTDSRAPLLNGTHDFHHTNSV